MASLSDSTSNAGGCHVEVKKRYLEARSPPGLAGCTACVWAAIMSAGLCNLCPRACLPRGRRGLSLLCKHSLQRPLRSHPCGS